MIYACFACFSSGASITSITSSLWILSAANLAIAFGAKEIEIAQFISQAYNPIFTERLVELDTCH